VAIAAPNVAFGDLLLERGDTEALLHDRHDVFTFGRAGAMVEIKDAEVGVPTVDARVLPEVPHQERLRLDSPTRGPLDDGTHVPLSVAGVVRARRGAVAVSADLLQAIEARGLPVELGQSLPSTACSAQLHHEPSVLPPVGFDLRHEGRAGYRRSDTEMHC
jgi:hypothetical protein